MAVKPPRSTPFIRERQPTLLDWSDIVPWLADCERVSSAESEPSSKAWLERTWMTEARPCASGPPRRTAAMTRNSGRSGVSNISVDLPSHLSG
ncbi:hypothetical protein D3C72_1993560 [compost metagenome]